MKKEHPILFSTNMVNAILNGNKTMTRRVVKPQPMYSDDFIANVVPLWLKPNEYVNEYCKYKVGDRLWVREAFAFDKSCDRYSPKYVTNNMSFVWYKNTLDIKQIGKWRPSIFMPRWASRITLEITSIKVERVNQILNTDVTKEGFDDIVTFKILWDKLNNKRGYGWKSNCWVWIVEFKLCQ